jgi:hypothetical protein
LRTPKASQFEQFSERAEIFKKKSAQTN